MVLPGLDLLIFTSSFGFQDVFRFPDFSKYLGKVSVSFLSAGLRASPSCWASGDVGTVEQDEERRKMAAVRLGSARFRPVPRRCVRLTQRYGMPSEHEGVAAESLAGGTETWMQKVPS